MEELRVYRMMSGKVELAGALDRRAVCFSYDGEYLGSRAVLREVARRSPGL